MTCTRCDGTGFLNSEQFPMDVLDAGFDTMLAWTKIDVGQASDVAICDCCGDGEAGCTVFLESTIRRTIQSVRTAHTRATEGFVGVTR